MSFNYPKNHDNLSLNPLSPKPSAFKEGTMYYDADNKTISAMIDTNITMQLGQEDLTLCHNSTGAIIPNGVVVYQVGASGDMPNIELAKADTLITSFDIGMTTQEIGIDQHGFVTSRGIIHDVDTSGFIEGEDLYLSPVSAGAVTNVKPSLATHYQNKIGFALIIHPVSGSIYVKRMEHLHGNQDALEHIRLTGFNNKNDSTMTVTASAGAFTFNIAPVASQYQFFVETKEYTKTSLISYTVTGAVNKTLYYIWFDNTGTLNIGGVWVVGTYTIAHVGLVYFDNGIAIVFDERHSSDRNLLWHSWAHNTIGARAGTGFNLTNPSVSSIATTNISSGDYFDEDIRISTPATTACRIWYRSAGASALSFDPIPSPTVYKLSGTRLLWDNNGVSATASNGDFVVYWIYANNGIGTSNGTYAPIYSIMGQATYATSTLAQNASTPLIPSYPSPELKLLYLVVLQQNNATTYSVSTVVDKRAVSSVAGTTVSSSPNASTIVVTSSTYLTSSNVQSALEELSLLKIDSSYYSFAGALSVSTGKLRKYFNKTMTLTSGIVACDTAPVGSSITADIRKNGTTTIGTFTVTTGSNVGTVSFSNGEILANDYLTINITGIGSSTAGSDLTLQLIGNIT